MCYGRTDLPLAEDVAAAAAARIALRSDPRLQEMNFGAWEMCPWNLIQRESLDGWAADPLGYAPPQGESAGQMRERVQSFVTEARHQGLERAALVIHAGVMKVIVGHAQGLPARKWMALKFDYESVVCVNIANPETKTGA